MGIRASEPDSPACLRCLSPAVSDMSTGASAPSTEPTFAEDFLCASHWAERVASTPSSRPPGGHSVVYLIPMLSTGSQDTDRLVNRLKGTRSLSVQSPKADGSSP